MVGEPGTNHARKEAQALREAASQRLGMEAGYLKRKADLIAALADRIRTPWWQLSAGRGCSQKPLARRAGNDRT